MSRNTTFTFYRGVNLSPRTNDTFYFDSVSAQSTYFASKAVLTVNNCSYQRADINRTNVKASYSTLYNCDYLSFTNADYENKKFYAFITDVTYVDDDTCRVTYVIDQFQTWFFQCSFHPCYVERNHANRDDYGENLLLDSVECGSLITASMSDSIDTRMLVIVEATFDVVEWLSSGSFIKQAPSTWNKQGIYDNLCQAAFYTKVGSTYAGTGSALQAFINYLFAGLGQVTMEEVVNIYCYPKIGVSLDAGSVVPGTTQGAEDGVFQRVYNVGGAYESSGVKGQTQLLPSLPTTIDGYTPKNKKLLQYPYCLIHISNNDGSAIDLHFERFKNAQGTILTQRNVRIYGTSCGEAKIRLVPEQYMGITSTATSDFDTALDSAPYPTCSLLGDAYNIYLAQNKNKIDNQYNRLGLNASAAIVSGAGKDISKVVSAYAGSAGGGTQLSMFQPSTADKVVGGMQTGSSIAGGSDLLKAGVSAGMNLYQQVSSINANFADLQVAPATATGISGVGLAFQNGKPDFTISVKTVDQYHARMIDDYYTMFGYPVRRITTPMLKARTKFTYVKTLGCILTGSVPEGAKSYIENMFDQGVRLWYSTADIGNFNVVNDPINSST